ncbi:hypothetical protein O0I10_006250 [Lichtheimia ornata]|uniref:Uncharacterized protein n=1 Tax=Lichtheimia ornata TaxID=688661 RepID=A0AAD7XUX6_9FUNG|nr:uncharacterized protein O0I10_006250 [Lichtheimia ornata]KAJ8657979.1 hypothetical protein O0I10_006250 [Lichtheimia ornata]
MEEDFYARMQAEGEPGESYIHAKSQLWRRLQLNQQEDTSPDISAICIGLHPHNEFFLNLKKPKNIEELRVTVRLADKCRANPSSMPAVVQPMTNMGFQANPSEQPQVQIVHNTHRREQQAWEARMNKIMTQMESLVSMQQEVLERISEEPTLYTDQYCHAEHAIQRDLVSKAIRQNGDTGAESLGFWRGGH